MGLQSGSLPNKEISAGVVCYKIAYPEENQIMRSIKKGG